MIKWIKAFVLGTFLWLILTVIYGIIIGSLDLADKGFFSNNSYLHNFILYPIGIWLGFKITKTSYFGITKNKEDEFLKVKSNKSTNPIENNLVPEKHLRVLAWTVACWRLTIENANNKMMPEKDTTKFCRLFLAQEKKRKKIKDYNRADVRILYTLSLSCPLNEVDKLIAKHGWTLEVGKEFEEEIGYR